MDSDDPSLAQVLERLEDVRKGSTLVTLDILTRLFNYVDREKCNDFCTLCLNLQTVLLVIVVNINL